MPSETPPLKAPFMPVGLGYFQPAERERYRESGYGMETSPGKKSAILVVDMTYEFCGRRGIADPLLPKSAGFIAWEVVDRLCSILPLAREKNMQVIYTRNSARIHPVEVGAWGRKASPQATAQDLHIVAEISPQEQDLVVSKTKPSAFFGSPLVSWLTEIGVDTLFVTGGTTSGCVRASVTDAFSHNYRVFVVADCVFDRSQTSHEVALFEMQQKYAALVEADQFQDWLANL